MDFIGIRAMQGGVEHKLGSRKRKPIVEGFTLCKYCNYAMVWCVKITTTQQCGRQNIGK
jgi:hypothetical protein